MLKGYGGTRGSSDTDVPFEFQNKGAIAVSILNQCADVNQFILPPLVLP